MKKLLLYLSLFVCSSIFAQKMERAFPEEMATLGGDVKLKSESVEVVGEEISKVFEVECLQDGVYFLDAWINIPVIEEKIRRSQKQRL